MSTNISKNYVNQSKAIFEISSVTHWASQMVLIVKNSAASAGDIRDAGLIPGWERSPAGGNGNPLQSSCLETPMHRGAWGLQSVGPQGVGQD